ncbi:hypothetical protein Bbelb_260790 [Branchiostoma belcheri]|nr:hypothetical protein Bbelb_260790 [Branchiostoma belcheri]
MSQERENNPVYLTNHPEEPTSPDQNEDPDQNMLYTESTANPTRMSTCGQTDNDDISTPEATCVYSVSDTTKAENAMYAASGENKDDANAIENIDEEFEPKVMQEDSTVADDSDMEPYAVANMSDHENYLMNTTTACFGPHKKEFPNPIYEENVCQQASDDTSHDANVHVHEVRNPTNAEEHKKTVNRPDPSDDSRADSDVHKASPVQEVNNLSTLNATEVASTTKKYTILQTFDGTNPKILGTVDGTNPPILDTVNGTNPPTRGTTDEKVCEENTMRLACAADELIVIDEAFYGRREKNPRCGCSWLQKCDNNCKQKNNNKQSIVRQRCQGLQRCDVPVDNENLGDPCPHNKKYLEVKYHCEEKKDRITFGGAGYGPGKFQTAGLAVSSTNEIFVTDEHNKRIQVFSMEGVFLRSFSTGKKMTPHAISIGRNDTLWVALYAAQWYAGRITVDKFGRVIVGDHRNSKLEMFTAEGKHIRTVAYVRYPYRVATGGEGQLVVLHSSRQNVVTILLKY